MNIGINGRVFSVDQPGGAGQAGLSLVKSLENCDVSITVYGHENIKYRLQKTFVEDRLYPVNSQLYGLLWEQIVLPKLISKNSPDVFFCPTMNAPIFADMEIPVVVQIHDIFRFKGDVSQLDKFRQRYRLPRMLANADKIITVSQFSKSEIVNELDIPKTKINVVHNGVDSIFFQESPGTQIEVPNQYLLYVGGTNARKNIDGLLQTFEILRSQYEIDHDLVMVGPDPKRFHSYPDTDLNGDHIHVTGFVSQSELKYIYENADLFLFPSYYEGFGMSPLESMACGTPVIASNRSSLPEVLDEGAVLVNPDEPALFADEAYKVLNQKEKRDTLIQRGKDRSSKFTWEKSAKNTLKVLRQVD